MNEAATSSIASDSKVGNCPYPFCCSTFSTLAGHGFCGCQHREPLVVCAACRVVCPGSARYCRACQAPLPPQRQPDCGELNQKPQAEYLFVPGTFHTSPRLHQLHMYCLSASGQISRLSLAPAAKAREWANIPSKAAGFNRFTIMEASAAGPDGRPTLLTTDPDAVWAVDLARHEASAIYRPPAKQEIVANGSAKESICFRGVAATSAACALMVRSRGAEEASLTVHYFAQDRVEEQPLRMAGRSFLGPVIENGLVGVCGEREAAVYRLADQARLTFEFKDFEPLFSRSSPDLNAPPGGMPLWVGTGERGVEMRVAGTRDGRTGLLVICFERHYDEFVPLPEGSSISTASPSGLCINAVDTLEFAGAAPPPGNYSNLEPGMPAGYVKPNLVYFDRSAVPGRHELTVFAGVLCGVMFEDRECGPDSCCALGFAGPNLVVNYIIPSKSACGQGLKIVYWRMVK